MAKTATFVHSDEERDTFLLDYEDDDTDEPMMECSNYELYIILPGDERQQ